MTTVTPSQGMKGLCCAVNVRRPHIKRLYGFILPVTTNIQAAAAAVAEKANHEQEMGGSCVVSTQGPSLDLKDAHEGMCLVMRHRAEERSQNMDKRLCGL